MGKFEFLKIFSRFDIPKAINPKALASGKPVQIKPLPLILTETVPKQQNEEKISEFMPLVKDYKTSHEPQSPLPSITINTGPGTEFGIKQLEYKPEPELFLNSNTENSPQRDYVGKENSAPSHNNAGNSPQKDYVGKGNCGCGCNRRCGGSNCGANSGGYSAGPSPGPQGYASGPMPGNNYVAPSLRSLKMDSTNVLEPFFQINHGQRVGI